MQNLVDEKKHDLMKNIKVKMQTLEMEMQKRQYSTEFQKIMLDAAKKFNCSKMVIYSSWNYFLTNGKSKYRNFNDINKYILTRLNKTL